VRSRKITDAISDALKNIEFGAGPAPMFVSADQPLDIGHPSHFVPILIECDYLEPNTCHILGTALNAHFDR
jgi:hypothetical protein